MGLAICSIQSNLSVCVLRVSLLGNIACPLIKRWWMPCTVPGYLDTIPSFRCLRIPNMRTRQIRLVVSLANCFQILQGSEGNV